MADILFKSGGLKDDNGFNIYSLKLMLNSLGYQIDCAIDGRQAIEMFMKK